MQKNLKSLKDKYAERDDAQWLDEQQALLKHCSSGKQR